MTQTLFFILQPKQAEKLGAITPMNIQAAKAMTSGRKHKKTIQESSSEEDEQEEDEELARSSQSSTESDEEVHIII